MGRLGCLVLGFALPISSAAAVDYYGEQELVYLGPDEQVIPEDINWIVKRAGERGCPIPSAFMSSRPDAGINHKEYGVTSEGVAVFLREALTAIGIAPTAEPWTVKLTGGFVPDSTAVLCFWEVLEEDI